MSTAPSWTSPAGYAARWWDAARDVGPLLRFRGASLRGRSRNGALIGLGVILLVTVLVSVLPAFVPEGEYRRSNVLLLLPSGYVGVLVISIVSAAASGGGRELLPREQAVAYPVSPLTDHLGALLMAPLNIAWLLQSWGLLAASAYALGPDWHLVLAQLPVFAWLVAATALAQVVGWFTEWVRRGPYGRLVFRLLVVTFVAQLVVLIGTHRLTPLLDQSPTLRITIGVLHGFRGDLVPWLKVLGFLVLLAAAAVLAGGVLASAVARRPARDELRAETSVHPARPQPASDFVALLRTDRVGIWRSVPLRRGLAVLTVLPGLVAIGGALTWSTVAILPGLVASGGALLFGVNSWCLDGRGALWRDSLPVSARQAFASRVVVLVEVLLLATLLTLAMASLRAGVPTVSELVAVLCAAVVVSVQVVATCLRWSVRRPFAVDLRSSRATPAPPLVMVAYSSKLALTTTLTGLVFSVAARADAMIPLAVAVPFLLFSGYKLDVTAREWADPALRAQVVATVAS
ncbi:MAG: hypothetical protein ACXVW2_00730 [Nocardioidaceae bacterium]